MGSSSTSNIKINKKTTKKIFQLFKAKTSEGIQKNYSRHLPIHLSFSFIVCWSFFSFPFLSNELTSSIGQFTMRHNSSTLSDNLSGQNTWNKTTTTKKNVGNLRLLLVGQRLIVVYQSKRNIMDRDLNYPTQAKQKCITDQSFPQSVEPRAIFFPKHFCFFLLFTCIVDVVEHWNEGKIF